MKIFKVNQKVKSMKTGIIYRILDIDNTNRVCLCEKIKNSMITGTRDWFSFKYMEETLNPIKNKPNKIKKIT